MTAGRRSGLMKVNRIAAKALLAEFFEFHALDRDFLVILMNTDFSAPVQVPFRGGQSWRGCLRSQHHVAADEADFTAFIDAKIDFLAGAVIGGRRHTWIGADERSEVGLI